MLSRLILVLCFATALIAETLDQARATLNSPPADARIMMRWWWFGPAVSHAELEAELRMMQFMGIGGVEIQPV